MIYQMSSGTQPNVLFLVWDAARFDYVKRHASTIDDLRRENVWFERAIAPSTWSLPSHASLFTGELPHEHEQYLITDQNLKDLPLVDSFRDNGYETLGVSGNGFASPRTGFAQQFDSFHYTTNGGPFPEGLNVTQHALEARAEYPDVSTSSLTRDAFGACIRHKRPLRSLVNFGAVTFNRLCARVPALERVPHPLCNSYTQYSYSTDRTTERITSYLADANEPFFLFANYMDTHRPYYPPDPYRQSDLTRDLSFREIADLNELAAPWEFIRRVEAGEDLTQEIQTIRSLYTGEVRSVDAQLRRILDALEQNDLYKNTVVLVTSDHGENLGETDLLGNTRMGHESSVSRPLLEVPLLIAGPMFDAERIHDRVSLRRVFDLLTDLQSGATDNEAVRDDICGDDDIVTAEYPSLGGTEIAEKYPNVSDEALSFRTSVDFVAGYLDDWLTVVDSTGRRQSWEDGTVTEYERAPDGLREAVETDLATLIGQRIEAEDISPEEYAQLEALGYM